jgi:DNA-directed RNA polymerase specialized sigma24 family protein
MTVDEYGRAYQRGFHVAVRVFLSRGVPYDDAIEYVQAAWVKGWERREQLRDPSRVIPWIVSIGRNLCNTSARKRLLELRAAEALAHSQENGPGALEAERILEKCNPRSRAILEAHYFLGLTVPEIATAQHISLIAANGRLVRARKNAKPRTETQRLSAA